jgi:hypothetical protein
MLQLNTLPAPMPAWGNDLRRGDVVLYRFPCAEEHPAEPPKRRTCLVLEVEDRSGRRFVQLAYGTSVESTANRGDEIRVFSPEETALAGVRKPTRFVCSRRIRVALDHPGWDINRAHRSPIIGRLAPTATRKMNAIRTRNHALRDIAADRRASRRRTFTVEHRRRRRVSLPGRAVRG